MKTNSRFLLPLLGLALLAETAAAQTPQSAAQVVPMSQRMADSFISWHPDSILIGNRKTVRWDYEQGLMMRAMERVWQRSGDPKYFTYIKKDLDQFVQNDGTIRTYKLEDYNLDNLTTGHALLLLSQVSLPSNGNEKYIKAAQLLRKQLDGQPRTKAGGFWHKKIYENQMWLDGLYMAEPFYAEYSQVFNQPAGFDDIAKQFALIEKNLVDSKTGLLYHGYDESRQQQWANKTTGQSPHFWDRGIGWYSMALVDVLDYFPQNHPQRPAIIKALQQLAPVLAKYQDSKTGTWSLVMNQESRNGNYAEASGSSMFVYALAKGVRMGYLDKSFAKVAQKGYDGLLKSFVATEPTGALAFNGTVSVGGLGGKPYRDGSYEYYLSEPLRKNDLKGVGPFILASTEMEIAAENSAGQNKTVGLDYHFNHEMRKNPITGEQEQWHYTWEERTHGGFWLWGNQFRELGAKTVAVPAAPTAASLKNLSVYIIVDPDSRKESPKPNYIQPADTKVITEWVKGGGTLVLFANDTANSEIKNFNLLAKNFGVQFTDESVNMVKGDQFEQGKVDLTSGKTVFKNAKKAYVKELAVLSAQAPAQPLVTDGGKVIMATAKLGKGRVFVLGDPWLYNEYVDGRKIPAEYQNFQAGKDLANWLLTAK
ncbi:glycoside hydrolase family 88/105 protein [Hymenobacter arizonensis]|uniref:Unsaturated rhamnogalacturonyl hydrolase n=1 Tax=Hymenobacter arizonensis TaxID=1227077 RepID=A0A1I5Y9M4_HYMAR|nr:glycoside hydrolase family 88 protein [Hymenobacter arizonensis]SFQ40899.1 unsaturated rhamnogalacturonyl hydrolase [Hymenobacter arizonensis]